LTTLSRRIALQQPKGRTKQPFQNALFQSISNLFKDKKCTTQAGASHDLPSMILSLRLPQNFLAPPDGFAIVPRILGNWMLNEMDNHGT
jgi:hypothetical protein